jgi:hypothetical protein
VRLIGEVGIDVSVSILADWSIIAVRPSFDDVTQCVAELLERNAHIPALLLSVVMAERLLRAKRRRPQCCHQIGVGLLHGDALAGVGVVELGSRPAGAPGFTGSAVKLSMQHR